MKTKDKLIIEKQKELIKLLNESFAFSLISPGFWTTKTKLESELSVLESSTDGREKDKICNDKCKWFKIGYGHCNFCIRQVKEHDCKDNFESSEPEKPKDKVTTDLDKIKHHDRIIDRAIAFCMRSPNTDELANHIMKELQSLKYAQQFQPEKVTDEEIDNYFPITSETTALTFDYIRMNKAKRIGAKAMRDGKIK